MIKGKGFEIIISSDAQYENICSEIYFDGEFVAIITQEDGIENAIIEIDLPKNGSKWTFNFSELIEILNNAKDSLRK